MPIWKRKGDVQDLGRYRGIMLPSYVMKVLESILDRRIRRSVERENGEEQSGFRKGKGMTDGMFTLRKSVKKRLETQGETALGFVDHEKAYATVPREMVTSNTEIDGSARSRS